MLPESALVLLVSFAVLVYSSHLVINASIKLSRYFHVGEFAIGFILVAITTSLPELGVSISAASIGEGGVVIGNVIGSNIADILLVLGFGALAGSIWIRGKKLVESAEVLLLMTIIPIILLVRGTIGFVEGLILLALFGIYIFMVFKSGVSLKITDHVRSRDKAAVFAAFFIGIAILLVSARFVVGSAVDIANALAIDSSIIALTIIAMGTCLPELIVDVNAIRRGHPELALGDILGSCVANLTLVLGAGALITDLTINYFVMESALFVLLIATIVLNYILFKYNRISKTAGLVFVLAYIAFLMWQIGIVAVV